MLIASTTEVCSSVAVATDWFMPSISPMRWVTLFNIAADREIAPELLQDACEGEGLAREVGRLLDDPALRARQSAEQSAALDKMGRGMPDPSEAAADALVDFLKARGLATA